MFSWAPIIASRGRRLSRRGRSRTHGGRSHSFIDGHGGHDHLAKPFSSYIELVSELTCSRIGARISRPNECVLDPRLYVACPLLRLQFRLKRVAERLDYHIGQAFAGQFGQSASRPIRIVALDIQFRAHDRVLVEISVIMVEIGTAPSKDTPSFNRPADPQAASRDPCAISRVIAMIRSYRARRIRSRSISSRSAATTADCRLPPVSSTSSAASLQASSSTILSSVIAFPPFVVVFHH